MKTLAQGTATVYDLTGSAVMLRIDGTTTYKQAGSAGAVVTVMIKAGGVLGTGVVRLQPKIGSASGSLAAVHKGILRAIADSNYADPFIIDGSSADVRYYQFTFVVPPSWYWGIEAYAASGGDDEAPLETWSYEHVASDTDGKVDLASASVTAVQSGLATSTEITALNDVSTAEVETAAEAAITDKIASIQSGLATATSISALNNLSSAQAQSAAAAAITAASLATAASIAALNNLSSAQAQSAAAAAITAAALATSAEITALNDLDAAAVTAAVEAADVDLVKINGDATAALLLVKMARFVAGVKVTFNRSTGVHTIYAEDGTTTLFTLTLAESSGTVTRARVDA